MAIGNLEIRMAHLEGAYEQINHRLGTIEQDVRGLRDDIGALRTDVHDGIGGLRTELREEMGGLRTELREEMGGLRTELREEMGGLHTELREEMGGLRTELREEMGGLRTENATAIGTLRADMAGLRRDLTVRMDRQFFWMLGLLVVSIFLPFVRSIGH